MDLLVTEVTNMSPGNFCVATWCPQLGRMVRPLPGGANWNSALLQAGNVGPGRWIQTGPKSGNPTGLYPHLTEDTPIASSSIKSATGPSINWFGKGAPPSHPSLEDAFNHQIKTTGSWNGALKGAHVLEGTRIGSLSAVRLDVSSVTFFEDNYRGATKLRAYLDDGSTKYSLPVVATNIVQAYQQGGTAAATKLLPRKGEIHIRVGLARAFHLQPQKCTIMLNGINW